MLLTFMAKYKDVAVTLFLILGVFGGFYIGTVRLDQILIYLFATVLLFGNLRTRLTADTALCVCMIICIIFLGLFGVVLGKTLVHERTLYSVVSQLENYLQIIAILLIYEFNIRCLDTKPAEIGLNFFFSCICLNAILILASVYLFTPSMLDPFHGGIITERADAYANGMSPGALSAQAGRHTGLFGQVFIAGTVHALALTILVASLRMRCRILNLVFFGFIMLGGILSGSKVFVVWTVPAFLLFLYLGRVNLKLVLLSMVGGLIAVAAMAKSTTLPWYFKRLFDAFFNFDLQVFLHIFTSSRFLPGSSILFGMEKVFKESPVFGFGFGTLKTSDFAFYEILAISGLLGTFIYILLLLLIYSKFLLDKQQAVTGSVLLLLVLLSSISGPVATGNKIAFLLIVIPHLYLQANGTKK